MYIAISIGTDTELRCNFARAEDAEPAFLAIRSLPPPADVDDLQTHLDRLSDAATPQPSAA
jgi:hypothetical protein